MTQNCVIVQFLTNIKVKSHSFDLHEFRTFSPIADILTCQSKGSQVRSIKIISTEFQLSIKSSEPCNDTGMLAELLRGDLVN